MKRSSKITVSLFLVASLFTASALGDWRSYLPLRIARWLGYREAASQNQNVSGIQVLIEPPTKNLSSLINYEKNLESSVKQMLKALNNVTPEQGSIPQYIIDMYSNINELSNDINQAFNNRTLNSNYYNYLNNRATQIQDDISRLDALVQVENKVAVLKKAKPKSSSNVDGLIQQLSEVKTSLVSIPQHLAPKLIQNLFNEIESLSNNLKWQYIQHIKSEIDSLKNVDGKDLTAHQQGMLHRIIERDLFNDVASYGSLRNYVDDARKIMIEGIISLNDLFIQQKFDLQPLSLSSLVKLYDQNNDRILKQGIEQDKPDEKDQQTTLTALKKEFKKNIDLLAQGQKRSAAALSKIKKDITSLQEEFEKISIYEAKLLSTVAKKIVQMIDITLNLLWLPKEVVVLEESKAAYNDAMYQINQAIEYIRDNQIDDNLITELNKRIQTIIGLQNSVKKRKVVRKKIPQP